MRAVAKPPTMTGRYGNLDYPTLTKRGLAGGLALFLVGLLGETVGPALVGPMPAWEHALLFDLEAIGVLVMLVAPFAFGVVRPLTE